MGQFARWLGVHRRTVARYGRQEGFDQTLLGNAYWRGASRFLLRKPELLRNAIPADPVLIAPAQIQSMERKINVPTPLFGVSSQMIEGGDSISVDYRSSHRAQGYGEHYNRTYESGYYGALWKKWWVWTFRNLSGRAPKCLGMCDCCTAISLQNRSKKRSM